MQRLDQKSIIPVYTVMMTKVVVLIQLAALALLLTSCVVLQAGASLGDLQQQKLRVGFTQRAFIGVNPLDVEAAYKTFARTVGVTHGYNIESTVQGFDSTRDLASIPSAERPDIIILDSWSYLEMNNAEWLEPLLVSSDRGQAASRYLLLARSEGKIKNLADLRGKSLNVLVVANASLGTHWLQALLQEHKLGTPEPFFGALEYHTNPMQTALPVFFGKKDAALVDSGKFELMAELNPQLNSLQTIASSEPLVNVVICINRSGWPSERFRQDLIQAITELHLEPAGRQILTLFKVKQMMLFKPGYLDTVRRLREKMMSQQNPPPAAPSRRVNNP